MDFPRAAEHQISNHLYLFRERRSHGIPLDHNLFSFPLFISLPLSNVYCCHLLTRLVCASSNSPPLRNEKETLEGDKTSSCAPCALSPIKFDQAAVIFIPCRICSSPPASVTISISLFHLPHSYSRSIVAHCARGPRTTLKSHRSLTPGRRPTDKLLLNTIKRQLSLISNFLVCLLIKSELSRTHAPGPPIRNFA